MCPQTVSEFRTLCRPTLHPQLSPFCTSLTGISQADVDTAPLLPATLDALDTWLRHNCAIPSQSVVDLSLADAPSHSKGGKKCSSGEAGGLSQTVADGAGDGKLAAVTVGDFDLGALLPRHCQALGLKLPDYLAAWCNIQIVYREHCLRPRWWHRLQSIRGSTARGVIDINFASAYYAEKRTTHVPKKHAGMRMPRHIGKACN